MLYEKYSTRSVLSDKYGTRGSQVLSCMDTPNRMCRIFMQNECMVHALIVIDIMLFYFAVVKHQMAVHVRIMDSSVSESMN